MAGVSGTPGYLPGLNDPTISAYANVLKSYFSPYFQQQQQNLESNLAATGNLTSGEGNQQQQYLTGLQDSNYAGALMPLIQQGFGQNFQQGQLASQENMQAQIANMEAQNQMQLAQMNYAYSPYAMMLGSLSGLQGQGLGELGGIYGAGQGYQYQGATAQNPYAMQLGANAGYNFGNYLNGMSGGNTNVSFDPTSGPGDAGYGYTNGPGGVTIGGYDPMTTQPNSGGI